MPGVRAIVTGADFASTAAWAPSSRTSTALAGKVRYVGEPVAAVAADAEAIARAAAPIEVDYEPLPAVLSIDEALAPGAAILHEDSAAYVKTVDGGGHGNVFSRSIVEGDVERAWEDCDVIVEETWHTQAQHHLYMEPTARRRRRRFRPDHLCTPPASRCITSSSSVCESSASR